MNALLWIDVETTGLDPTTDVVLALGLMRTGPNLEYPASLEIVFKHDPDRLKMSDYVREMHTKNGLLERCKGGCSFEDGTKDIWTFLHYCCPAGAKMEARPYVAGSTISFDRSFMLHNWPWYRDHVHYRSLDVSSLRTEISLMRPELLQDAPKKRDIHLPLADIEDSQNLLRFLRSKMWGAQ